MMIVDGTERVEVGRMEGRKYKFVNSPFVFLYILGGFMRIRKGRFH